MSCIRRAGYALATLTCILGIPMGAGAQCLTPAGDIDASGQTTIVDVQCHVLVLLDELSGSVGAPSCLPADSDVLALGDRNCDSTVTVADTLLVIGYVLGMELDTALDSNGNAVVDACEVFDGCGEDADVCTPNPCAPGDTCIAGPLGASCSSPTPAGDYCVDDSFGSATTPLPVAPDDPYPFTTLLEECSLTAAQAWDCIGAEHESNTTVAGGIRTITGNAIPNHDVDLFPNIGNPNTITPQNKSYSVVTQPTLTTTPTGLQVIGVSANGMKLEPQTAEVYANGEWRYEALTFLGRLPSDPVNFPGTSLGFDCNFAHVQPNGEYHYHGVPTGLMPQTPSITLVGWAADGYPILGRYGYSVAGDATSPLKEMTGSFQTKAGVRQPLSGSDSTPPGEYDGTFVQDWVFNATVGDLDECNGRQEDITVNGETFDYAYYLTYTYPYMPRCVWGTPHESFGGPVIDPGGDTGGGDTGGGDTGGGDTGGPQSCDNAADCTNACPPSAVGCTCAATPQGNLCIPTCQNSGQCPAPPGMTSECGANGLCGPPQP